MSDRETVTLDIDVNDAKSAILAISQELGTLKSLGNDIGTAISKAFVPLQSNLNKTIAGMAVVGVERELAVSHRRYSSQ